jgi:tRNA pseudouridine38-40 synthase
MTRYFAHIAYKGTNYHGWQSQPNAVTVQETLNNAFSLLLNEKISLTGAGRTDTGVHAKNFYAHFDSENPLLSSDKKLIFKLNCYLPNDINIFSIYKMSNSAHARFDASERVYKYYIALKKEIFFEEYCWQLFSELNIDLMNEAAKQLYNYSDFTSFSKLHTNVKTNTCKINKAVWSIEDNLLVFTISADRFLRNMVRSIVGTLIDLGLEKKTISDLIDIIKQRNRAAAGTSVPAKGLFLYDIKYPYQIR